MKALKRKMFIYFSFRYVIANLKIELQSVSYRNLYFLLFCMCLYANQVEKDWQLKKITNKVGQFMLILISIILTINLFQTIFKNYCTFI